MANKLPWTTPKVQTLYTTSSVGRLIAEYLDAGGQMLQMREGVLGHGNVRWNTAKQSHKNLSYWLAKLVFFL